jgi:hypothetical protein
VEVLFLMPVNAEGDDPFERPSTLLARLARRVEGLARWQDAAIAADWPALAAAWREASYGLGQLRRDFTIGAAEGVLRIGELAAELWPLLVIGSVAISTKGRRLWPLSPGLTYLAQGADDGRRGLSP